MGLCYVTTYVEHPDSSAIVSFLETLQRHAYVFGPQKGYSIVYDEQAAAEDPQNLSKNSRHYGC